MGQHVAIIGPAQLLHAGGFTVGNQVVNYCYDAAGNMLDQGGCSNPHAYQYDAENRLATTSGGILYTYDASGQRVVKNVTQYFYFGGQPVAELNGGTWSDYIFAGSKRIAVSTSAGSGDPNGVQAASTTSYYHGDQLGSSHMMTTGTIQTDGSTPSSAMYAPFGQSASGNIPSHYKFTGKERDTETGLDYFGARYYASNMGRFTSPDPGPYVWSDPQTLNRYAYTRNNPLKFIDPTGKYFVVAAQDQKFYQKALTDLYRRPGGRELVNSLAQSDRAVLLDRRSLDTAHTGLAGVSTALAVTGQPGVAGVHVTVGTDADLMAGAKMAPGKVSSDVTTAHELEHANDGITQGQNSLSQGAAAMATGDAPSSPGASNTTGGTAQAGAEEIMGEKTDMSGKDAGAAVQDILKSGQQQWQDSANRTNICSQNPGACH